MALRTAKEYKKSLRDDRSIYVYGEKVKDVTTHPVLSITVEHSANVYELARKPEFRKLFTFKSPETGKTVSRYFMLPKNNQELLIRGQLIEENTRQGNSSLNITKAVGTDGLLALTVASAQIDKSLGTDYSKRVRKYLSYCRENDLSIALAQTDVKGDRGLRPHQQADPDLYVRIVERRKDGIVVRGAKAHTTASAAVNEIIALPTRAMLEADKDYAVAFAVPVATKGLTLICRPTISTEQSVFDYPISRRNIENESLTVFDDVFVPWERVFLCDEWQYAGLLATTFANFHRFTAISYKPPTGDIFIGAAQLIAEYNGVDQAPHVREKIAKLIAYTEIIRACRNVAAQECLMSENGIAMPNPVYTNIGKHHFASHFHEAAALVQDIAGGLAITAPTERDWNNPEIRPYIKKYLAGKKDVPTEYRLRLFKLIQDMTASDLGGYNYVTSLHGEGSMAAQLITTYRDYNLERCKKLVKAAMGIK